MTKEDQLNKIYQDIKSIKIQGANSVAEEGIKAFLLKPEKSTAKKLSSLRPTEPMLQNALKILLKSKNRQKSADKILDYLKNSKQKIKHAGQYLIGDNMNIFTHCHSSTVVSILKHARELGKKFVVYNTETYPLLQGRKTAKELAKAKIKVIHVPDNAADHALKKCNLFLFGTDAFTKKGVLNKIGTSMYCKVSSLYNIPAYACGISMKYTPKIKLEYRSGKEVWDEREKNIKVLNPAFDLTKKQYISGVISEFGNHLYPDFIDKAKKGLKKW